VYSAPPLTSRRSEIRFGVEKVALSASGRTVLTGQKSRYSTRYELIDAATGRSLWRPGDSEGVSTIDGMNEFYVGEGWTIGLLNKLLGGPLRVDWATNSIRNLETGRTLRRYWWSSFPVPWGSEGPGGLAVRHDGAVCRAPNNWLLLSFCQAILALPIVLLWFALLWRRKRRLRRLAEVAP